MSKAIYVVGGSKGGVGKSLVSMSLIHNLTQRGEEVFVIDADTSNPDVFKSYEERGRLRAREFGRSGRMDPLREHLR